MNNKILFLSIIIAVIIFLILSHRLLIAGTGSFSFKEVQKEHQNKDKSQTLAVAANFFESEGNIRIAYFPYIAENANAGLILIHGGGAHSNAGYQSIAQGLRAKYKISTYLIDMRGHGLSGGRRGDTEKIEFVFQDIKKLIALIKSKSDKPVFLSGHSSGCGVILNYISRLNTTDIAGVIFISPEFGYKSNTKRENIKEPFARTRTWVFALSALSGKRLFMHTKAVYLNYPPEILNRDKLLVNSYTAGMAYACTPENPEEQFKKIDKPVQIIIGENDELIDPEKLPKFLRLLDSKIRSISGYKILSDATHLSVLLHSDSVIAGTLLKWIKYTK